MDHTGIRRALRIATLLAWVGSVVAAVVCAGVGIDAHLGRIIGIGILLATITATWAIVETVISIGERIIARMPSGDAIAAYALLRGHAASREELEAQAEVPRISDYRR